MICNGSEPAADEGDLRRGARPAEADERSGFPRSVERARPRRPGSSPTTSTSSYTSSPRRPGAYDPVRGALGRRAGGRAGGGDGIAVPALEPQRRRVGASARSRSRASASAAWACCPSTVPATQGEAGRHDPRRAPSSASRSSTPPTSTGEYGVNEAAAVGRALARGGATRAVDRDEGRSHLRRGRELPGFRRQGRVHHLGPARESLGRLQSRSHRPLLPAPARSAGSDRGDRRGDGVARGGRRARSAISASRRFCRRRSCARTPCIRSQSWRPSTRSTNVSVERIDPGLPVEALGVGFRRLTARSAVGSWLVASRARASSTNWDFRHHYPRVEEDHRVGEPGALSSTCVDIASLMTADCCPRSRWRGCSLRGTTSSRSPALRRSGVSRGERARGLAHPR